MGIFSVVNDLNSIKYVTNSFVLKHDNWNDYWEFKTLYGLYYVDRNRNLNYLGEVKIGDKSLGENAEEGLEPRETPKLPNTFDSLNKEFFSVGQSKEYYLEINKYIDEMTVNPLEALQDMAYNTEILEENIDKRVMRISLLRNVSATTITRQFRGLARGGAELTRYNFSYVFNVDSLIQNESDDDNIEKNCMDFKVEVDSTPSTNIHVLIGRNGVGKSKLLSDMINTFLDNDEKSGYFLKDKELVDDPYSIFPNLIYMSYSPFDSKAKIEDFQNEWFGNKYIYIGIKKTIYESIDSNMEYEDRLDNINELSANSEEKVRVVNKDEDDLAEEFVKSFFQCTSSKYKKERLKQAIIILQSDPIFEQFSMLQYLNMLESNENKRRLKKVFNNFSSGHGIILLTITRLTETVEEKSLVLLDEPETHLHPPLLSSFITCLSELLKNRNAVAIIATHSPVVLQEVPSSCVWILNRSLTITKIDRPQINTYGESYNNLVKEVFGLELQKSGYHHLIEEYVNKETNYESFLERFDNLLGSDADIIARTLFLKKEERQTDED